MDPKQFQKLAKQLKLPPGGHFYGKSWSWDKHHGHAGAKILDRVREAAQMAGWQSDPVTDHGSPDGSVVGRGRGLVSPEGHVLMTRSSYGATAYDNTFSINLKLMESPVKENKTMKLTQEQFRRIVAGAVKARLNEDQYMTDVGDSMEGHTLDEADEETLDVSGALASALGTCMIEQLNVQGELANNVYEMMVGVADDAPRPTRYEDVEHFATKAVEQALSDPEVKDALVGVAESVLRNLMDPQ